MSGYASQSRSPSVLGPNRDTLLRTHGELHGIGSVSRLLNCFVQNECFQITVAAMQSDVPEIALQGIEFWSSICEEEIDIANEGAAEADEPAPAPSKHFGKGAASHLCPILLETLAKQDESDAEDDWTPSKAAGVCLMLLAQCARDEIIPSVLPFFAHFSSPNWRYREAAIMAFGSILEGPDRQKLIPLAEQAMPALVKALTSDQQVENSFVKEFRI